MISKQDAFFMVKFSYNFEKFFVLRANGTKNAFVYQKDPKQLGTPYLKSVGSKK